MVVGRIITESRKKFERFHLMPLGTGIKVWVDIKTCSYWSRTFRSVKMYSMGNEEHRLISICVCLPYPI